MRRAPRDAIDAPGLGIGGLGRRLDAGLDQAIFGAQVAAEPAHHQRGRVQVRCQRLQLVQRGLDVRLARRIVRVLHRGGALAVIGGDDLRRIDELAGAGDQRHAGQKGLQRIGTSGRQATDDLELQLRDAVAELFERQVLEHDVAKPAIGRRVAGALDLLDQRIEALRLVAGIEAGGEAAQVDQRAVRPYAADLGGDSGAEADREGDRIAVIGFGDGDLRAALAAAGRGPGRGDGFLEAGRPEKLARHAHATIEARNRRALGRGLHVDVGQPRSAALDAAAGRQRIVDLGADQGAECAADLGARDGRAQNREAAEQRTADRRTDDAENERSHAFFLLPETKTAA